MTQSMKDLLNEVLQKYKLEPALHRARLPEYWRQVVGDRIAALSEVRSFDGGVLRVHVREAVWRSELTLRREELRQKLNSLAGGEMIREIIIR
jgi:predicted nucleic acid-binding Zn ribbon protein